MTHNLRKKNSRQRGEWTHGWGAKKKHRGAGHRGGRGLAGSGKRGDAKKPRYWKTAKYFGKNGFSSINPNVVSKVGISHLDAMIDTLLESGKAKFNNDLIIIDLKDIGCRKLLGTGFTSKKFEIIVEMASAKAVEKIEKAGGKVVLPKSE
ncbi:MAG: uL15m family ribosomal protein [Candidatus Woesearchaeota archaeon]